MNGAGILQQGHLLSCMNILEMMEADLAHAEEAFEHQVEIGGSLYPCRVSDFRSGESSDFEYMAGTADVEIRVRKSVLGLWVPAKGAQLDFNGEHLEVEHFVTPPSGLEFIMFCAADLRR